MLQVSLLTRPSSRQGEGIGIGAPVFRPVRSDGGQGAGEACLRTLLKAPTKRCVPPTPQQVKVFRSEFLEIHDRRSAVSMRSVFVEVLTY